MQVFQLIGVTGGYYFPNNDNYETIHNHFVYAKTNDSIFIEYHNPNGSASSPTFVVYSPTGPVDSFRLTSATREYSKGFRVLSNADSGIWMVRLILINKNEIDVLHR